MKHEHFRTYFSTFDGKQITFERWTYSKLASVNKAVDELVNSELWKTLFRVAANNAGSENVNFCNAATYKVDENGYIIQGTITTRTYKI